MAAPLAPLPWSVCVRATCRRAAGFFLAFLAPTLYNTEDEAGHLVAPILYIRLYKSTSKGVHKGMQMALFCLLCMLRNKRG